MTPRTTKRLCGHKTKGKSPCKNKVSGRFKYCCKHRKGTSRGKVNMIGGGNLAGFVSRPNPKLHELVVPCMDAAGRDCGWHLMDDHINWITDSAPDFYPSPLYIKAKLFGKEFVLKKHYSAYRPQNATDLKELMTKFGITDDEITFAHLWDTNAYARFFVDVHRLGPVATGFPQFGSKREMEIIFIPEHLSGIQKFHASYLQSRVDEMRKIIKNKKRRLADSALQQGGVNSDARSIIDKFLG